MKKAISKAVLFILALVASAVFFALGYLALGMTAFDAAIAPSCILAFSLCLLFLPADEDND